MYDIIHKIKYMKTKCKNCNNVFSRVVKKHDKKRGKYCSRKCYYESQKAKIVTLTCKQCGKSFQREKWRISVTKTDQLKNFYCSTRCSAKYKRDNPKKINWQNRFGKYKIAPELIGDLAKKEYESGLRIIDIANKYGLSYSATNARIKRAGVKTDRGRYAEQTSYTAIRRKILLDRGNKCLKCGWSKGRCDIHHVVQKADGGTDNEDNLIIVCPNCHRLIHENKLKI